MAVFRPNQISDFLLGLIDEHRFSWRMMAKLLGFEGTKNPHHNADRAIKSNWSAVYKLARILDIFDYELIIQPRAQGSRRTGTFVVEVGYGDFEQESGESDTDSENL